MRVRSISVTYARKFNLGDYNGAEIGCTMWGVIDPDENEAESLDILFGIAKSAVKEQAMPLLKKQPPTNMDVFKTFMGKPIQDEEGN